MESIKCEFVLEVLVERPPCWLGRHASRSSRLVVRMLMAESRPASIYWSSIPCARTCEAFAFKFLRVLAIALRSSKCLYLRPSSLLRDWLGSAYSERSASCSFKAPIKCLSWGCVSFYSDNPYSYLFSRASSTAPLDYSWGLYSRCRWKSVSNTLSRKDRSSSFRWLLCPESSFILIGTSPPSASSSTPISNLPGSACCCPISSLGR